MSDTKPERMPPIDSEWMGEHHRKRVHDKPTHFPNGTPRPATQKQLDKLAARWRPK